MLEVEKEFHILCGGQSVVVNFITKCGDDEPANFPLNMVSDRDFVGLSIRNTKHVRDKVMGISFRRRDRLQSLKWCVTFSGEVIQSSARFGLTDRPPRPR